MQIRLAAGVLFAHPTDPYRPLLVKPAYREHWDLPGGIVEPGELARDAAAREVKEELGIVVSPGRLLVTQKLVSADASTCLIAFVFDGGRLRNADSIMVDGQEVVAWEWCNAASRAQRLAKAPYLAKRIEHAIWAQRWGTAQHLDHRATA